MKILLVIGLAIMGLAGSVQARLGETEQECEARYGKPTPSVLATPGSDKTLTYSKDDIHITAEFVKGRCQRISYSKPVSWNFLTQQQVDFFLKVNSGSSSWGNYNGGGPRDFVRSDGATAIVSPAQPYSLPASVVITLPQWQKAHDKALKDVEVTKKAAEEAAKKERAKKFEQGF